MKARRNRTSLVVILLSIIFCAAVLAGAGYIVHTYTQPEPETVVSLLPDGNVKMGTLNDPEGRQRELDAMVEEGMLAMSINATPFGRVSGAEQDINWMIENPSNQGKLIRVEIWRDDTGEKIYETGAIPPGNYVESAPLKEKLPAGEYSCTARFYAYREEDEAYIGQAGAQIKLTLQE